MLEGELVVGWLLLPLGVVVGAVEDEGVVGFVVAAELGLLLGAVLLELVPMPRQAVNMVAASTISSIKIIVFFILNSSSFIGNYG